MTDDIKLPEPVAWRMRKPVVNDKGETVGATAWELSDAPCFLPWWTNDPLIRLSDYAALQVECERLRLDAERYRWAAEELVLTGLLRFGVPLLAQNKAGWDKAIDAARAALRN